MLEAGDRVGISCHSITNLYTGTLIEVSFNHADRHRPFLMYDVCLDDGRTSSFCHPYKLAKLVELECAACGNVMLDVHYLCEACRV